MNFGPNLRIWYTALRPFSYSAAVVPILVGTAVAWHDGHFEATLFFAALIGSVFIQMGTNLANEYLDYVQGIDKPDSLGPAAVIVQDKLSARQVLTAAILVFAAGTALGIYIAIQVGIIILAVGLVSLSFAWFYTAKPFALGYRGLGEPEVFIFMGPVMVLSAYYVQARTFAFTPLFISLPVAFLVMAILHANNLRDIEQDMERGRLTWAVLSCKLWGNKRGRQVACWGYYLMLTIPYVILIYLSVMVVVPWLVLTALLTIPQTVQLIRFVSSGIRGKPLSRVVRGTSLLHLTFGLTLTIGYLLGFLLLS